MANHKSAEKRARQSIKRNAVNTMRKKAVKTVERRLSDAIKSKNTKEAVTLLQSYSSQVDRAAKKKILSKNHASRKKARLSALVSSLA